MTLPIKITAYNEAGIKDLPFFNPVHISSFQFSAGETQVRLDTPGHLGDSKDFSRFKVEADIGSSEDLVALALVLDALNWIRNAPIELHIPYLPYSRQDRRCAPGESFALKAIVGILADFLSTCDKVVTWDVHSPVAQSLFSEWEIPFQNRKAAGIFDEINESLPSLVSYSGSDSNVIVVAPDKGAESRADSVREWFNFPKTVFATKVRETDTGKILETRVPDVSYLGKRLLIVDDICDGGRTFIELAKVLRTYNPKSIDLYVTHGIFSKGFESFGNLIDNFYVGNLLPNRGFYDQLPNNLFTLRQR